VFEASDKQNVIAKVTTNPIAILLKVITNPLFRENKSQS
jgi:hypothetical protein